MNNTENLLECEVCHKKMKESRMLSCQHTFCGTCLSDDVKNDATLTCPKCAAKYEDADGDKKDLALRVCSVCEKEQGGWFCEECDQFLCSACLDNHNKYKFAKDHNIVKSEDEELKIQSNDRFYCVDCEKIVELEFLESHDKHEVKQVSECIKETVDKWKIEIRKIRAYEVVEKDHMREGEKKLMDKKEEVLKIKDQVKGNYQKLIEVLKTKEALEYARIDADLSRMEKEHLEHQGNIEKSILLLKVARSKIESQLEEIKKGLPEGFRDDSPYKMPQIHSYPNLKHHLSFQPIPKEAVSKLQSCIMNCSGVYEAEKAKIFEADVSLSEINERYMYSGFNSALSIYSVKTLRLLKTITFIYHNIQHICHINNRFYTINNYNNIMVIYDEDAAKLGEVKLPSSGMNLTKGEAGKVLITCQENKVCLYDPESEELESILVPCGFDDIRGCWSLGGGEYCMKAKIEDDFNLIKVVDGKIEKVIKVSSDHFIHTNTSELVCIVENGNKLRLVDRQFELILEIDLNLHGSFIELHIDQYFNILVMSKAIEPKKYCIRKYKMIPSIDPAKVPQDGDE